MKRKIVSIFLAAIMLLSAIPVFAQTYTAVDGFAGATCQSYSQIVKSSYLDYVSGTIENNKWTVTTVAHTESSANLASVLTLPKEVKFADGPFSIEFNLTENSETPVKLGVIGFSDGRLLTEEGNEENKRVGITYANQYFGLMEQGTKKTTAGDYKYGVSPRVKGTTYKVKMDFTPSHTVNLSIDGATATTYDLSETKAGFNKISHMTVTIPQKTVAEIVISDLKITQEELDMQASVEGNAVKVAFDSEVDASTLAGVFTSTPACDIEVSYDDASKIATLTGFDYGAEYTVTADVSKINAGKDGYLKRATAFSANVTTESYVSDVVYSEDFEGYSEGAAGNGVFQYYYVTDKDSSKTALPGITTSVQQDSGLNSQALKVVVNSSTTGQSALMIKLPKTINYADGKTTISATMRMSGAENESATKTLTNLFGVTSEADGITNTYSNTLYGYGKMGVYAAVHDSNLKVFSAVQAKRSGSIISETDFRAGKSVKLTYTINGSDVSAEASVDGVATELTFGSNAASSAVIANEQTAADYLVFVLQTASGKTGKTTYYLDDITVAQEISAKVEDSSSSVYGKKPIEIKSNLLLDTSTVDENSVTVSDGTNAVACDVALANDKQTIIVTPENEWVAETAYTVNIANVTVLNTPTKALTATVTVNAVELISNLSAAASGTAVTVSAALNDSSFDGAVIAALYNAQDVLLGAVIVDEPASSISETITVEENTDLTDAKVKMFAWNSISTMVPAIDAEECSVD